MKKFLSSALIVLLLLGFWPLSDPAYGETLNAGSRTELINTITDQIQKGAESFAIHYRGAQDLANDNVLTQITEFDGSENNTMLQTVYGLESIEGNLRYSTGKDIQFTFRADYNHSRSEAARLDGDLQGWVDNNISADMDGAVKSAIITKYLSQRLLYLLDTSRNNGYDGYYSMTTACSGYAELTWQLLKKAGLPVKMVAGYTPDGLSDTEFLAKRITSADMLSLANQDTAQQLQTLHVWNMVQIGSKWYQLDTTWLDGDRNGEAEDGEYHPEYFLGSDGDFGRSHAWIRSGYPVAPGNWWEEGSGELRNFMKAYLNTRIYDYPQITSLAQLNTFAEEAYRSGRGSQTFRITQGVQPYDAFPALGSALDKVVHSRASYREAPKYPGDGYLLTLEFEGRDAGLEEAVPEMLPGVTVTRGESLNSVKLFKHPERSDHAPVKFISLSPTLLGGTGDTFNAVKEGRGYIGAYTRDQAVIIPVTVNIPPLRVFLNGSALELDPSPTIVGGRTLVPLRGIFEAMGAVVVYDPQARTITATRGVQTLILTLGSKRASVNGREVLLDVPPQIMNDRAFVPARMIAESFGGTVEWDAFGNRVLITE